MTDDAVFENVSSYVSHADAETRAYVCTRDTPKATVVDDTNDVTTYAELIRP